MLLAAEIIRSWGQAIGFDMTDGVARGASNSRTQVAQLSVIDADVVETVEHDAIRSGPVMLEDAGAFGHVTRRSIPSRRRRRHVSLPASCPRAVA